MELNENAVQTIEQQKMNINDSSGTLPASCCSSNYWNCNGFCA